MAARVPCGVCRKTHRTELRRIAGGNKVSLCASCYTALVKLHEWKRANSSLEVTALMRVFEESAAKPAAVEKAPPREKIA